MKARININKILSTSLHLICQVFNKYSQLFFIINFNELLTPSGWVRNVELKEKDRKRECIKTIAHQMIPQVYQPHSMNKQPVSSITITQGVYSDEGMVYIHGNIIRDSTYGTIHGLEKVVI